jgi:hypothetical protein
MVRMDEGLVLAVSYIRAVSSSSFGDSNLTGQT